MNPNRVVIDTNVFISALLNPLGTPKKVINIAVSQFTILQSEATYQELATRISKNKFDKYLEKDDRLDFLSSLKLVIFWCPWEFFEGGMQKNKPIWLNEGKFMVFLEAI